MRIDKSGLHHHFMASVLVKMVINFPLNFQTNPGEMSTEKGAIPTDLLGLNNGG